MNTAVLTSQSADILKSRGYDEFDLELLTESEVQALFTPISIEEPSPLVTNENFAPALQIHLGFDKQQIDSMDIDAVVKTFRHAIEAVRGANLTKSGGLTYFGSKPDCKNELQMQMDAISAGRNGSITGITLVNFPDTDIGPRIVPVMNSKN